MLFNGTSSRAETTGLGNVANTDTARTFCAIVRVNSASGFKNIISLLSSGNATVLDLTFNGAVVTIENDTVSVSGPTISPTTGWYYVAVDKAAGNGGAGSTKFHIQSLASGGGTMSHSTAAAITMPTTPTKISIGTFNNNNDWFNGDIMAVAVFNRQLANTEHEWLAEDLGAWVDTAPDWLTFWDQDTTSQGIPDLSGGGAAITTKTSLAVTTQSMPLIGYGVPIINVTRQPASGGTTITATTGTATAAGVNATGLLNPTPTVGAATAAGVTPTFGASVTATVGTATAAGVNATPSVNHTATVGTATAAGLSAAAGQAVTATVGTATAAGVNAAGLLNPTPSVGTATAAGQSATFSVNHTATVGAATATGKSATFTVTHTSGTPGNATAAGLDGSGSAAGGGGPASPNNGLPVHTTGVVRLTRMSGPARATTKLGITRTTSTIIITRRTTKTGPIRTTTKVGPSRLTATLSPSRRTGVSSV